jgi:hypothetical protein
MKSTALAIAGFVLLAIGFIERCWLNGPGIAVLPATGLFLVDATVSALKRTTGLLPHG